jgi:hypothetical protein
MLRLYLRPRFDGRKINSIEWLEVELFATSLLEQGLSTKTIREILSVLSLIMKTAVRARVIRENPAAGYTLPSRKRRTQILDDMPEIVSLVRSVASIGARGPPQSERIGHTEIGVTMNVYGHLFESAQGQLTKDLDELVERSRPHAVGEGGKRADGAEEGRETLVNNGHLRSTTVTRKRVLSWENPSDQGMRRKTVGVRFPPAPQCAKKGL